jgi:cytosine/adenosine deaminase-related metal-dependent hydrolase
MLAIGLNAATLTAAVVFGLAPFDPGYDADI